jgi:hypothetical protein
MTTVVIVYLAIFILIMIAMTYAATAVMLMHHRYITAFHSFVLAFLSLVLATILAERIM